jgi:hypothetical protein
MTAIPAPLVAPGDPHIRVSHLALRCRLLPPAGGPGLGEFDEARFDALIVRRSGLTSGGR